MKKLMSLFSIIAGTIIFCSVNANAQNHGNKHHQYGNNYSNGNYNNNNNYNNGGYNNGGGYNNNNNCNNGGGYNNNGNWNNNNNCNNNGNYGGGYSNGGYSYGSSVSFGYTYTAPCAPTQVVVVRPVYRANHCAPRPHCSRW